MSDSRLPVRPNFAPNTAPLSDEEHAIASPSTTSRPLDDATTRDDTSRHAAPALGQPLDIPDEDYSRWTQSYRPYEDGNDPDHDLHAAIGDYAQGAAEGINARLRGGQVDQRLHGMNNQEADGYIRALEESFRQSPGQVLSPNGPRYVYRAMDARHLGPDSLEGKHLHDKAFLSVTTSQQAAEDYARENLGERPIAVMRLRVPEGTKGLVVDRHQPEPMVQKEIILNRGARLSVSKHDRSNPNRHIIHAELIGHE